MISIFSQPRGDETRHARSSEEPTSQSTLLPKDSKQVAGYLPIPTHEPPFRRVRLRTNFIDPSH